MEKTPRDWSKVKRTKAPYQVTLRLTAEENAELETRAERRGVSKAGYVKSAAFGQPMPRASKRPNAHAADVRQILGLLGKLGSNANQIARRRNMAEASDHEAAQSLRAIRDELATMRALLLKALNGEP